MNKKRALWVCCDIQGTYELGTDGTVSDHETCFKLIDEIRKEKNCDIAIFSFISAEDSDYVSEYFYGNNELIGAYDIVKSLNKSYGTKITFGPQIGGKDYFYVNHSAIKYDFPIISKAEKIVYHDKLLIDSGYDIVETIYIDDSPNINISLLLMRPEIIDRIINSSFQLTTIENHLQTIHLFSEKINFELINKYDEADGITQENIKYVNHGLNMHLNDIRKNQKQFQKVIMKR